MGAGFYLMIAASIVVFRIAVADKKRGWLWSGINLCVSMIIGKFYGLSIPMVGVAFIATFFFMFLSNIIFPKRMD